MSLMPPARRVSARVRKERNPSSSSSPQNTVVGTPTKDRRRSSNVDAPPPSSPPSPAKKRKSGTNQAIEDSTEVNVLANQLRALKQQEVDKRSLATLLEKTITTSFSKVDPDAVSRLLDFEADFDYNFNSVDWDKLEVPMLVLPESYQEKLATSFADAYVATGGPLGQLNEAARALSLAHRLILLRPFAGRLVDHPETHIMGSDISGGGRVESTILAHPKTITQVTELKWVIVESKKSFGKVLAQVICEVYAAARSNERLGLVNIPVQGVITDGSRLIIIQYDPSTQRFAAYKHSCVPKPTLEEHLAVIPEIYNLLYSILVDGYIRALKAYLHLSLCRSALQDKAKCGSQHGVDIKKYPVPRTLPALSEDDQARPSSLKWESALKLAIKAQKNGKLARKSATEQHASRCIELLLSSACNWPDNAGPPIDLDSLDLALKAARDNRLAAQKMIDDNSSDVEDPESTPSPQELYHLESSKEAESEQRSLRIIIFSSLYGSSETTTNVEKKHINLHDLRTVICSELGFLDTEKFDVWHYSQCEFLPINWGINLPIHRNMLFLKLAGVDGDALSAMIMGAPGMGEE